MVAMTVFPSSVSPKLIRAARLERGLSQSRAGREVGVEKETIANWERGRSEPRLGQALRLAEVYGVNVEHFVASHAENGNHADAVRGESRGDGTNRQASAAASSMGRTLAT